MKFTKSTGIIAIATMTLSAAALASPYPFHDNYFSDDDVITSTTTSNYSDDDVTEMISTYSDDDVTETISTYSDDDHTETNTDQRFSWESNWTSSWSDTDERASSSANANDHTFQDVGDKANSKIKGETRGHSNMTKGSILDLVIGPQGNPLHNNGLMIDNTDNNSTQFGIDSDQKSAQAGGDMGDRLIQLQGFGNTDGSASGPVTTLGSSAIDQNGNNSLDNLKSLTSAASNR